jgi:8-oxo-dGTP pyrophosphatase MutT (NUDIX family)
VHSGQIGFPGGKKEIEDRDLVETAFREAEEEAGISRHNLKVVGFLTPLFIPVSNIIVTPVVAWMNTMPSFSPDNEEVMFIIEADLSEFISYNILREKPFEIRGEKINIKYFDYRNNVIWGASAMILHELLTLIKRAGLSHQV